MSLVNNSTFRTSDILALFRFVRTYVKYSGIVKITIKNGTDPDGNGFGGEAGVIGGRSYDVNLAVKEGLTYPRTQRLNSATPRVTINSWDEEFVLVLAHELRHIDQFVLNAFNAFQEFEAEVDAEKFACAVLKAYKELRELEEAA